MSEQKHTPGPWRWQRAENGQGSTELTLVGSPDKWVKCEYFCSGWEDGSPRSRGPIGTPGHEHNTAPTVLCADGWHGSGDLVIEPDSPDAHLIAAAPDLLEALKELLETAEGLVSQQAMPDNSFAPSFLKAQSVITKAEGKS